MIEFWEQALFINHSINNMLWYTDFDVNIHVCKNRNLIHFFMFHIESVVVANKVRFIVEKKNRQITVRSFIQQCQWSIYWFVNFLHVRLVNKSAVNINARKTRRLLKHWKSHFQTSRQVNRICFLAKQRVVRSQIAITSNDCIVNNIIIVIHCLTSKSWSHELFFIASIFKEIESLLSKRLQKQSLWCLQTNQSKKKIK